MKRYGSPYIYPGNTLSPAGTSPPSTPHPAGTGPFGLAPPPMPDYSESGFRNTITFLRSPAVGASFIALALTFLIFFLSNALFCSATLATIGIIVTLTVIAFIGLVLLILFLL